MYVGRLYAPNIQLALKVSWEPFGNLFYACCSYELGESYRPSRLQRGAGARMYSLVRHFAVHMGSEFTVWLTC